jgi:hypothetical protein
MTTHTQLSQEEVVRLFSNFLKRHKAYKRHSTALRKRAYGANNLTELVSYISDCGEDIGVLIDRSFTWSNTIQGHKYWSKLDVEWRMYVADAKKNAIKYNSIW